MGGHLPRDVGVGRGDTHSRRFPQMPGGSARDTGQFSRNGAAIPATPGRSPGISADPARGAGGLPYRFERSPDGSGSRGTATDHAGQAGSRVSLGEGPRPSAGNKSLRTEIQSVSPIVPGYQCGAPRGRTIHPTSGNGHPHRPGPCADACFQPTLPERCPIDRNRTRGIPDAGRACSWQGGSQEPGIHRAGGNCAECCPRLLSL